VLLLTPKLADSEKFAKLKVGITETEDWTWAKLLLLENVTNSPLEGAGPLRFTVHSAPDPATIGEGI
jgi:hypothetical protein